MATLLVTGGAGFIGSNFIHYWLREHPEDRVINYDLLTYAANLENLKAVESNPRYSFVQGNIGDYERVLEALQGVDIVVNFAAESHNCRSVEFPEEFFETNVLGTQTLCQAALDAGVKRFHHISTCEVFGELELDEDRAFLEDDPYLPRTAYNASKAGGNHAVMAYYHSFGLPVTISHCGNNYGPYQYPEKLISLFTTNALEGKKLPLFKSSQNKREWVHTEDHARAIDLILQKGRIGEAYNVGTGEEYSVEEVTDLILEALEMDESLKTYVEDRPGHDKRYLLDCTKIRDELGFEPQIDFESGLKDTIEWYKNHPEWWKPLKANLKTYERRPARGRNRLKAGTPDESHQQTSVAGL